MLFSKYESLHTDLRPRGTMMVAPCVPAATCYCDKVSLEGQKAFLASAFQTELATLVRCVHTHCCLGLSSQIIVLFLKIRTPFLHISYRLSLVGAEVQQADLGTRKYSSFRKSEKNERKKNWGGGEDQETEVGV